MKTCRVLAGACLFVILALTALMISALAAGDLNRFFIFGGVLVAALILSYVLVKTFKDRYRKKETDDGAIKD